jgi:putative transposase
MVCYRRSQIAGGTYFFTVTLRDRRARWLVERIDDLEEVFRSVKRERPFHIEAMVINQPGSDHSSC